ncbi:MAG: DUF559 domain-containing protein [Actinomycetota bacterium]
MSKFREADRACGERAAQQAGAFSRAQALEGGQTERSIESRLRSGEWISLLPNVYSYRSAPASHDRDLWAALLWAGPGSMVAGRAAAALYELRSFKPNIIEVCTRARLKPPDGVVLHTLSPYLDLTPTFISGIPTTPIEKTIFDLISIAGKKRAGLALDEALRLRLTTLERFAAFVEQIARQGRNGVRKARELIAERDPRYEKVRGPSEIDALKLFDGVRLPVAEVDHEIWHQGRLLARCDFAYLDEKMDIEIDGDSVHGGKTDKDRDRKRDRRLEALGWTVIRFSWEEVRDRPHVVIGDIKAVLDRLRRQNRA